LLFLLTVATTCDLFAKQCEVRYFSKIAGVISPMLEFNLRGEISKLQSKNMRHYKVSYDEKGRVKSIKFFHRQWPSNGAYYYAHEVRYQYQENQKIRAYYNTKGEPMGMWRHYYRGGEIHKELYDTANGITTLSIFNTKGEQIEVGTGTYHFKSKHLNDKAFIQWQFKKDGTPNVIFDYLPFEVSMITKNEHGFLYQIIALDSKSDSASSLKRIMHPKAGFSEMRLNFDVNGNENGWDFRDVEGKLVDRPADGSDPGYATWKYKFDWKDERLGLFKGFDEFYFDKNNKPVCKTNGICRTRYDVDEFGNFTNLSTYDKDNKLFVNPDSKYAKFNYSYNDYGRRVKEEYFDESGELRKEGTAVVTIEYDDWQGAGKTSEFDYQMKPIIKDEERAD